MEYEAKDRVLASSKFDNPTHIKIRTYPEKISLHIGGREFVWDKKSCELQFSSGIPSENQTNYGPVYPDSTPVSMISAIAQKVDQLKLESDRLLEKSFTNDTLGTTITCGEFDTIYNQLTFFTAQLKRVLFPDEMEYATDEYAELTEQQVKDICEAWEAASEEARSIFTDKFLS